MLWSDKISFKTKAIGRDKGYYIMIKGTTQQENITLLNIYAPKIGAPKYVKQILMDIKGEIYRNRVIDRDFHTPMDRSSRQEMNKEAAALNETLDQIVLIGIFRAFHPKAAKYTYFSNAHGMFSRIDHMLGHKTGLKNLRRLTSYQASALITLL